MEEKEKIVQSLHSMPRSFQITADIWPSVLSKLVQYILNGWFPGEEPILKCNPYALRLKVYTTLLLSFLKQLKYVWLHCPVETPSYVKAYIICPKMSYDETRTLPAAKYRVVVLCWGCFRLSKMLLHLKWNNRIVKSTSKRTASKCISFNYKVI